VLLKVLRTTNCGSHSFVRVVNSTEAEYDAKLKALTEKHASELSGTAGEAAAAAAAEEVEEQETAVVSKEETPNNDDNEERHRKQEKARRKREKAREKELEREQQIAEEAANAGPSPRDVENDAIRARLPANCMLQEVKADGHCMYRAVASQCGKEYPQLRTFLVVSVSVIVNFFFLSPFLSLQVPCAPTRWRTTKTTLAPFASTRQRFPILQPMSNAYDRPLNGVVTWNCGSCPWH
jgi:hypothetical protein